jgi:hypothetical protein
MSSQVCLSVCRITAIYASSQAKSLLEHSNIEALLLVPGPSTTDPACSQVCGSILGSILPNEARAAGLWKFEVYHVVWCSVNCGVVLCVFWCDLCTQEACRSLHHACRRCYDAKLDRMTVLAREMPRLLKSATAYKTCGGELSDRGLCRGGTM